MASTDASFWTGPIDQPRRYVVEADAVQEALSGGEGLVYRAVDTERQLDVALKLMTTVSIADYGLLVERASIFETVDHPNLMKLVDVFIGTGLTRDLEPDVEDFDVIYTVSEWIDGAPLSQVAPQLDAPELLAHVSGIARALAQLHSIRTDAAPLGVVHRDVKPSNVRVSTDGHATLIDFGVARPLDDRDMTEGVGTYRWRAPEVLSGSSPISSAVDGWGLGAVAYWCLTGEPPGLDGASAARERLCNSTRSDSLRDPVSVAGHIAQLLETNPGRRPADLERWARELDAIVRRGRRPIGRRAIAGVAGLVMAPVIGLVALTTDDDGSGPGGSAPSTTATSQTASTGPTGAVEALALDDSTGHVWNVDCLGDVQTISVTGAADFELVEVDVRFADGATVPAGAGGPLSYAQDGPGPSSTPNVLRAGTDGSIDLGWFCDRREVGVPIDVTLTGADSGRELGIRITSQERATMLDVQLLTNWQDPDLSYRLPVGAVFEAYVSPRATRSNGDIFVPFSRNFDPRMRLTASDPALVSVVEASLPDSILGPTLGWVGTAVSPGTVTLRAEVPGTTLVGSLEIEVFDLPDVPRGPDGTFTPGALTTYLMDVLDSPAVALYSGTSAPDSAPPVVGIDVWEPYQPFLPACDAVAEFDDRTWIQVERLQPLEPPVEGIPRPSFTVLTFTDSVMAQRWSAALRERVHQREGLRCPLAMFELDRIFDPLEDISEREYLMDEPAGPTFASVGLSAHTIDNTVVVALGFRADLQTIREALAAI